MRHLASRIGPLLVSVLSLTAPSVVFAQQGAPIHGFNAVIATPHTIDQFYTGVNDLLGKGGKQIHRLTGGGDEGNAERAEDASLEGLMPGVPVVVHYVVKGVPTSGASSDASGGPGV